MKVVLNSWWEPQGISTLTVQIARYLEGRGHEVQIMPWQHDSYQTFDHNEDSGWFHYRGRTFKEMLRDWCPDLCIPIHHVPYDVVSTSMSHGIRVCPLILWERVREYMPSLVRSYRTLVTNYSTEEGVMDRYKLSNVHLIPWTLQLPVQSPTYVPGMVRMLYNAGRPHNRRCGHLVFHAVREILASGYKDLHLKVRWLEHLNDKDVEVFTVLRREYPEHVSVVTHDRSYESVLKDFNSTDVFLWPTQYEGLGLMGMEAQQNGCVVMAPDSPTVHEMLTPEAAILVPGAEGKTYEGVPTIMPTQVDWTEALVGVIDNITGHVDCLKDWQGEQHTRDKVFDEAWDELLK